MISLPAAARVLPLTQDTFAQLLARSTNPDRLRGCFSGFLASDTPVGIPKNTDDDVAMATLLQEQKGLQYYFSLTEPDLSGQWGPYFCTVFYHPSLQIYVKQLLHNADGNLWVDLTATDDGFKITVVSLWDPTFTGKSATFAFANHDVPVLTWVKPVHDEDFLRRILPSVMRNIFNHNDAADWWGCEAGISLCKGICLFARPHGVYIVKAVVDIRLFKPQNSFDSVRMIDDDIAAFSVPDRDGNNALRLYQNCDERLLPYLKKVLSTDFGIELPDNAKIRYFYWQRLVKE